MISVILFEQVPFETCIEREKEWIDANPKVR